MSAATRPHRMANNRVPVYYAGGEHIDRFRGEVAPVQGPEDWVGSMTAFPPRFLPPGEPLESGISHLPDGTLLRAAVLADPTGWLGPELSRAWDGEAGLLVKLLDAGERLPVHAHPSRPFAATHLRSPFGKTEGWIVMDDAPGGEVWLGFREDVSVDQLARWVETQAIDEMLAAMNRLPTRLGGVFYVPAGVPHAIGPGVMITELQEPTSFSILAEYAPFGLDADQATLGLGWTTALEAFDRSAYGLDRLGLLMPGPAVIRDDDQARVVRLFDVAAGQFFQALRCAVRGSYELPASFSVLVIESGEGQLGTLGEAIPIHAGETWVVPYGAGVVRVSGDVGLLVCLPPDAT